MEERRRGGRGRARGRARVERDPAEVARPGTGGAGRPGPAQAQAPGDRPQAAVQQQPAPAGPRLQGVWGQRQQQQQAQQVWPAQGAVGGHPMPPPGAVGGHPMPPPGAVGGHPMPPPVEGPPRAGPQGPWGSRPPQAARGLPPQQQPAAQVAAGAGRAARRGTSRVTQEARGDAQMQVLEKEMQGVAMGGSESEREDWRPGGRPRFNPYEELEIRRPDQYGDIKLGKTGAPVMLKANFFKLDVPQDLRLYQYHVDFVPYVDGIYMRRVFLRLHREIFGEVFIFDGTCLFLPHPLPKDEYVVNSLRLSDGANIRITIRHTCNLAGVNQAVLQFLNIMWRGILRKMELKQINRHYFDVKNRVEVKQHRLQVLSGFESSILRYENDVLLGIDMAHKMLRTTTVLDIMGNICRGEQIRTEQDRQKIADDVVGRVVMTRYNNKTYTIHDIDFDKRVTDSFEKGKIPALTTFYKYYFDQYQVRITNMDQPLLMTKSKKVEGPGGVLTDIFIYLVPELCLVTGLSETHKSDFRLKKDLSVHTKVDPAGRVRKLESFIGKVVTKDTVAEELSNWNFKLNQELVTITGRRLPGEKLYMPGPRGNLELLQIKNGTWGVQGMSMIKSVNLASWLVIFPKNSTAATRNMVEKLIAVGRPLGMNIAKPEFCVLHSGDRYHDYAGELKKHSFPPNQLVFCILPNNRKDRYDNLKSYLCLENPVPSQMALHKTMADCLDGRKDAASVATKIAIQMNCKLGGVVWRGDIPLKETMIVGIDTYHDTRKDYSSAGGVVASVNADFTRYKSTVTFQTKNVELHNHLQVSLNSCLKAYAAENDGAKPKKIIIFRDGIGDGQLRLCLEHEVQQVKNVIGNDSIKLVFIVVKKRTNARFFLDKGGNMGGRGAGRGAQGGGGMYTNPEGGTVIDTVATRPTWMDFYLIPQTVRVGSASPTHYNVLYNDTEGLQQEHFQRLAYKLTHMYFNWQGTIRVPAPCMYAHKLAFLAGQSLHRNPDSQLTNHLYYL